MGDRVELLVGENPNFLQPLFLVSDTVGILGTELLETIIIQMDVGEKRMLRIRLETEDRENTTGHI